MKCPPDEDLASFATGGDDREIARHMAECAACADIVRLLRASDVADDDYADAVGCGDEEGNPTLGEMVGRYVILRRLGSGGMGVVVLAYDPALDRMVALKMMRADRMTSQMSARLEREAQSMARVVHPNVVRVFDAGTWAGRAYLVMEHLEARSLRTWSAETTRSTTEVMRIFVQVARGLAATHAAGFVHRDVKPDNILIGADGVARLADFGLVGWDVVDTDGDTDGAFTPTHAPTDLPLTRTDATVGTPGYMAPEQREGGELGPAADQFAFCASMWETLFSTRAFAGDTDRELADNVIAGRLVEPATDRDVPGWVREVVRRGLRPAPQERWPSINAVADALEHDPVAIRRRRLLVGGVAAWVVVLAGLAAFGLSRRATARDTRCEAMDDAIIGVWDADRAAAVRAAFVATERPYAVDTFDRVARQLGGYTREWVAARVDTCEATHRRGDQSEALLDLRMACLDRRLGELGALIEVFTTADVHVLDKAVLAAVSLSPLRSCDDIESLQAIVAPPAEGATRDSVAELRDTLARAKALEDTGQYAKGLALARAASDEAERIGYAPALAEGLYRRASLEDRSGDAHAAEATFERALLAASAARDDALAAQIWADLIYVVGGPLARPKDALLLRPGAEAAVARAQREPETEAKLWTGIAIAYYGLGKYEEALDHQARSVAILEEAFGSEHPNVASSLVSLGIIASARGSYDDARRHQGRALAVFERTLGADHPNVAAALTNLGITLYAQGTYEEARRNHARALVIFETSLGAEHSNVAAALTNLGLVSQALGNYDEARRHHQRALDIRREALDSDHPDIAVSLNNLGSAAQASGNYEVARRYHEQALAIRDKALGSDHPDLAASLNNLGDALQALGEHAQATRSYERALAIWEASLGTDHPLVANALTGLARALLSNDRADQAMIASERAVQIREAGGVPDTELAASRFALARASWALDRDRARAQALARAAKDAFEAAGDTALEELAEVEAWLRTRGSR